MDHRFTQEPTWSHKDGNNADSSANIERTAACGLLRQAATAISAHVDRLSGPWPIDDTDRQA